MQQNSSLEKWACAALKKISDGAKNGQKTNEKYKNFQILHFALAYTLPIQVYCPEAKKITALHP